MSLGEVINYYLIKYIFKSAELARPRFMYKTTSIVQQNLFMEGSVHHNKLVCYD